MQKYSNSFH